MFFPLSEHIINPQRSDTHGELHRCSTDLLQQSKMQTIVGAALDLTAAIIIKAHAWACNIL